MRGQVDASVVPGLQGPSAAASAVRVGVQPGNFSRRLARPGSVMHGSLTSHREELIKIGARVIRHAKYGNFQMAEVAVPRELFAAILERIGWFGVPPPRVQRG